MEADLPAEGIVESLELVRAVHGVRAGGVTLYAYKHNGPRRFLILLALLSRI